MPTPFDLRCFLRSLAIGLAAALLALAVIMATDGGQSATSGRIARLCAMTPILATVGAAVAAAQARARGESRALEALGVHPTRVLAGAVGAAFVLTSIAAFALASPGTDLQSLFPRVPACDWVAMPSGRWVSPSAGAFLGPKLGEIGFMPASSGATVLAIARLPVVVAVLISGLILPLWGVTRCPLWQRLCLMAFAALGEIAVFHLVAAEECSAWALLAAPAMLLCHVAVQKNQRTN